MPDDFDACFEWLGIPPTEQPPNHYRLLGIPLFVENPRVVENAADQRMAHLRTFQTGRHAAESQRLLNDVAAARICLLNPQKKAAYDERLRQTLGGRPEDLGGREPASKPDVFISPIVVEPSPTMAVSRSRPARQTSLAMPLLLGAGAVGLVLCGLLIWSLNSGSEPREAMRTPTDAKVAQRDSTKPPAERRLAVAPQPSDRPERSTPDLPPAVPENPPPPAEPVEKPAGAKTPTGAPPLAVAPFDEEQAKNHQRRWAQHLQVSVELTNSIGMKLVLIPPGEFLMGTTTEEIAQLTEEGKRAKSLGWYLTCLRHEAPRHRVRITRPYRLGATEVTQEQYQRVMGSNPSHFQGDPERPVEAVAGDNAMEFCRRLSELPEEKAAGRRYTLPTEAQWEHACRAGNPGRWWFSGQSKALPTEIEEKLLSQCAWFSANADRQTHPVAQKRANPWGLYDVYGNVWEWCQDWFDSGYYAYSPEDDPPGPAEGGIRMHRGGCWSDSALACRSAFRDSRSVRPRNRYGGFRVLLTVEAANAKSTGSSATAPALDSNAPPLAVAPFDEKQAIRNNAPPDDRDDSSNLRLVRGRVP